MNINREALAWAAGFFDGEGHTRVSTRRNAHGRSSNDQVIVGLTVSQAVSSELLERFRNAVGVGAVHGPYEYRHSRPNQKPFYTFDASGFESVQHCICCLWPWLGSAKRTQALAVLRRWRSSSRRWHRAAKGHSRLVCIRGHRVEGDNAYVAKSGHSVCRECRRHWDREARKKHSGASRAETYTP